MTEEIREMLSAPFRADEIEWRAGTTNKEQTSAMAYAYITARAVMDRLDQVFGIDGWQDSYRAGPNGGLICALSVKINDVWITKEDGADNTNFEPVKGGISDALKRTAVKLGIGRYLYKLDTQWVSCKVYGKTVKLEGTPKLPAWALPNGNKKTEAEAEDSTEAKPTADDWSTHIGPDEMLQLANWGAIKEGAHPRHFVALLNLSPFKPGDELAPEWFKEYRGARDAGKDAKQAAAIATKAYKR